ncbi:glycine--tRNA ligase [Candidatus Rariloculus sp.]|uniref:glycine--tRNA ligase n=1 Tax=Candidatus Rariloculus sp. TaxID=3101265 RepID=UPI003D123EC4
MDSMEKLVSLTKRRGFVFPSSEIYGGLNGCWDYGPLGVALKRNVKQAWWEDMITRHDETETGAGSPSAYAMVGLDSALLMNPRVWEASGHVSGFSDPMVDCRETRNRYRADQFIVFALVFETQEGVRETVADMLFGSPGEFGKTPLEELVAPHRKRVRAIQKSRRAGEALSIDVIANALENDELRARTLAPGAAEPGTLTAPRAFNLMFKTYIGALEDSSSVAYLRPETAQGIFVNFKNVLDTTRVKLPFGIGQIGKAFRNEINPRNFTFRSREFEQMEMEFFCRAADAPAWYAYWRERRYRWYVSLGIRPENLVLREHEDSELAHYAAACADVEYRFPFGQSELEGIANRADFDLRQHMQMTGKDLRYFDDQAAMEEERRYLPHVIEPAAGADRATLAFLCDAYTEDEVGNEARTVMKLHPRLAPVKAAVFPLVRKEGMPDRARAIYRALRRKLDAAYDEKGAIGRRYRRQDEAGTPYCVTIDGQTLTDDTVTVRERDSCAQRRVGAGQLADYLADCIEG